MYSVWMATAAIKLKDDCSLEGKLWQTKTEYWKQRHHFANKSLYCQSYDLSSGHVWRWNLDHKEGWIPKNQCYGIMLEKILESPLYCKKIKAVNPKWNQPWIFIERTIAGAEVPILWPPDVKGKLIGKDPNAGKDWGQEEKRATEHEMVGWSYQLNGRAFEQTPGDSEGQGSLAYCCSWGHKESETT